jgi:DNA-binding MarR family transcriptional regulator
MQEQLMPLHADRSGTILRGMAAPSVERAGVDTAPGLVAEWRELLDRHAAVSCALEKALQDRHELGLSEFEVLDRLVDAASHNYRMGDLAHDIHLSQSALSRTVDRLVHDGLVTRGACAEDRRAVFVCLTEKGRKLHAQARPTHRDVLRSTWDARAR